MKVPIRPVSVVRTTGASSTQTVQSSNSVLDILQYRSRLSRCVDRSSGFLLLLDTSTHCLALETHL